MSPEPQNSSPSPQPRDKRKSRSRSGSYGASPKQPTPPPFWKSLVINLLRGVSGFLETTAVKLETEQQDNTEKTVSIWQKLQLFGNGVFSKIRGVLPRNLPGKLPTPALIGILAVIFVIAIWTISSLFPTKPTEVANITPSQETPPSTMDRELEITPTPSIKETPLPEPEVIPTPPVIATPVPEITPTPSIKETPLPEPEVIPTPPVIATPVPEVTPTPSTKETPLPEPEVIPTPTPVTQAPVPEITPTPSTEETSIPEPEPTPIFAPTKKVVLTPEQTLIAAIEERVAEISDRFASGLIKSIQANFRTSSLRVIIDDQWYSLPTSEQSKLAAEMLQRSQELDFSHLEIMDSQKRLIARNPVVGTEMIIFTKNPGMFESSPVAP
ncbi:MAG: hypothetical protein QNJ63_26615 [Calothrix sp. MO_192.B10]|nr:hypothetical protein [Calothrix sp. MO_192.B10]